MKCHLKAIHVCDYREWKWKRRHLFDQNNSTIVMYIYYGKEIHVGSACEREDTCLIKIMNDSR